MLAICFLTDLSGMTGHLWKQCNYLARNLRRMLCTSSKNINIIYNMTEIESMFVNNSHDFMKVYKSNKYSRNSISLHINIYKNFVSTATWKVVPQSNL